MNRYSAVVAAKRRAPAIGGGSSLLTGLVAYWALEDLTESVGGLTLTNNASTTFTTGRVNNAATLNGSTQYLTRADTAVFHMGTTTNFTMSAWYKTSAAHAGVTGFIFHYGFASGLGFGITFANQASGSDVGDGPHAAFATNGANATDDGAWHFAVMTVDRAANLSFYRDNVLRQASDCTSVTGTVNNLTHGIGIGARYDGVATSYFNGMVDECGFWSRILTGAEMTTLYNSGSGITYPF